MADMSQAKLRCGSGGDGGNAEHGAPELDTDSLHHVLLRLAECGAAKQLVACSRVCRLWYAGVLADDLWRLLLSAKWGPLGVADGRGSHRSRYVRSVTTRVLVWGQGVKSEIGAVAPIEVVGVRAVSAGAGFSCAVTSSQQNAGGVMICMSFLCITTHELCFSSQTRR
jgi:hypothetical protein